MVENRNVQIDLPADAAHQAQKPAEKEAIRGKTFIAAAWPTGLLKNVGTAVTRQSKEPGKI